MLVEEDKWSCGKFLVLPIRMRLLLLQAEPAAVVVLREAEEAPALAEAVPVLAEAVPVLKEAEEAPAPAEAVPVPARKEAEVVPVLKEVEEALREEAEVDLLVAEADLAQHHHHNRPHQLELASVRRCMTMGHKRQTS